MRHHSSHYSTQGNCLLREQAWGKRQLVAARRKAENVEKTIIVLLEIICQVK